MKEIVDRLQETRQVELAKSILESKGYKVSKKKIREEHGVGRNAASYNSEHEDPMDLMHSISDMLGNYGGIERFKEERDGSAELDDPCKLLGGSYRNVYMVCSEDYEDDNFRAFQSLVSDMEDIKSERKSYGYNILGHSDNIGKDVVYQNMSGMITYFVKF